MTHDTLRSPFGFFTSGDNYRRKMDAVVFLGFVSRIVMSQRKTLAAITEMPALISQPPTPPPA